MVHGYHMILSTYGFWLPNDPRGSMSRSVYSKHLTEVGAANRSIERTQVTSAQYETWRRAAVANLQYPPVSLRGDEAFEIAIAIGEFAKENRLAIWAFSILEEHLHLVLGRYRYKMEVLANLLKGAATRSLTTKGIHPMHQCEKMDGAIPGMWSEGQWIEYLDTEEAIENAIRYVEENPVREGKKRQHWSFVQKFEGISQGAWISYH